MRTLIRQLTSAPGYSLAVIVTLALAIGVNTAVFSILDGFLLRSLPYPQADRIAAIELSVTGNGKVGDQDSFTGEDWNRLRESVHSAVLASYGGSSQLNLGSASVRSLRVSADYVRVLGLPLRMGRTFSAEEDHPGGPAVVIVSNRAWRALLGGDPDIIGKSILLKGQPTTVVGVLSPAAQIGHIGFSFGLHGDIDVLTPLQPARTGECGGSNCGILARLQPGAHWSQLATELAGVRFSGADGAAREHYRTQFTARPFADYLADQQRGRVLILMSAVGFVLLIACANLAGLALVRFGSRSHEIATRLAIGASRGRVLRQLWAESLTLASLGTAAALLLAHAIVSALPNWLPEDMVPLGGFAIDDPVLAFSIAATVLASFAFGVLPILGSFRFDLRTALVSAGRSISPRAARTRQLLVAGEVALTVALLASAGLLVRTLLYLQNTTPGFDPHNVVTARISLDDVRYHDAARFQALVRRAIDQMQREVSGSQAAFALSLPYERGLNDGISILDGPRAGIGDGSSTAYVTPGFFDALRIPLLSGRVITQADTITSEPVAVVNRSFARKFFPAADAIGHHFKSSGVSYRVIGVVADVKKVLGMEDGPPLATEPLFYVSPLQMPQGEINAVHMWFQPSWIVRAPGDPATIARQMQVALQRVDSGVPFTGVFTMDQILARELQRQRVQAGLLLTLAGLALLLSIIGVYALVANTVLAKRREMGIRLALGCSLQDAVSHLTRAGAIPSAIGVAVGIIAAFGAARLIRSEVWGVPVYDPLTFLTVPIALLAVAFLAGAIPAAKVLRLDPAETLRSE